MDADIVFDVHIDLNTHFENISVSISGGKNQGASPDRGRRCMEKVCCRGGWGALGTFQLAFILPLPTFLSLCWKSFPLWPHVKCGLFFTAHRWATRQGQLAHIVGCEVFWSLFLGGINHYVLVSDVLEAQGRPHVSRARCKQTPGHGAGTRKKAESILNCEDSWAQGKGRSM